MTWGLTDWADLIGSEASRTALAAGAITSAAIDCTATSKYVEVGLWFVTSIGTTPDDDVTIQVYGRKSGATVTSGTRPIWSAEIPATTSVIDYSGPYQIHVGAADEVKVKITNDDSTDAIGVYAAYVGAYNT